MIENYLLNYRRNNHRQFSVRIEEIHEMIFIWKNLARSLYNISIRTANVIQHQTTENIEMSIQGSDKQIAKIFLKDYVNEKDKRIFQPGNLDQFEIEHENIGKVRLNHMNILTISLFIVDWKYYYWFQWRSKANCMVIRTSRYSIWRYYRSVSIDYKWEKNLLFNSFRGECWLSNHIGNYLHWTTLKTNANHEGNINIFLFLSHLTAEKTSSQWLFFLLLSN